MIITNVGIFPGGGTHTLTNENETSLKTVPGNFDVETIHLDAEDISADTGFMLVDLTDTINWPHTKTGHIDILYFILSTDPASNFSGDIELGFLTNVDATNGDFNELFELHLEKQSDAQALLFNYGAFGVALESDHFFGPITANDTTWQTDVDIQGPDGNVSYPSGNGDLAMKIVRTAGDISVSITIGYRTVD